MFLLQNNTQTNKFNTKIDSILYKPFVRERLKIFSNAGGPTIPEIEAYVRAGDALARRLSSGQSIQGTTHHARDLMWFLTARVCETNQQFISGTLRMDDPEKRIFDFLNRCQGIAGSTEGNRVYDRISTHFGLYNHTLEEGKQKGLDMGNLHLPGNKHTLLFSQLPDGTTFIKMETHGCPPFWKTGFRSFANFQEFVGHTLDLFKSKLGHSNLEGLCDEAKILKPKRENVSKEIKTLYHKTLEALASSRRVSFAAQLTERLQQAAAYFFSVNNIHPVKKTPLKIAKMTEAGISAMAVSLEWRINAFEQKIMQMKQKTDNDAIQKYEAKLNSAKKNYAHLQAKLNEDQARGYQGLRQGDEATLSALSAYFAF
jgi:hypothetical protein